MATFAGLQRAAKKNILTGNFRNYKDKLFNEAACQLLQFKPYKPGYTSKNPIQILDFFSGAGGTSLGFAAINQVVPVFHFLGGCDIDPLSAATYSKNFGTPVICEDILKISKSSKNTKEFLCKIGYNDKKPLFVIGCAPCQGFSAHRKKHWNKKDDDRNNLVIAFSRIVNDIKPDVFIMENVPEFLSKRYCKYFNKAKNVFNHAGYTVKQNIYNAAEFGVPQNRFRSIIIGMKKDFLLPVGYLDVNEYKTVRDVIEELPPLKSGDSDPNDILHKAVTHKKSTIEVIKKVPHDGGNLPEGIGPICLTRVKGFYDVYGRLSWDKPAITITHYARNPASGRYTHPVQDRGLTAREAARLQSFPDSFQFEGKSDDIYRQIGEAVPPLLSCAVTANLLVEYLSSIPNTEQLSMENIRIKTTLVNNSYSNAIVGANKTRRRT